MFRVSSVVLRRHIPQISRLQTPETLNHRKEKDTWVVSLLPNLKLNRDLIVDSGVSAIPISHAHSLDP